MERGGEGSNATKESGKYKRCAKIDPRKTRLDIRMSKIEQRKWLLIL